MSLVLIFKVLFADQMQRFYSWLKGEDLPGEVVGPVEWLDKLSVNAVDGFEVVIYCQRVSCFYYHPRWYLPSVRKSRFRVFSTTSDCAPDILKEACQLEMVTDTDEVSDKLIAVRDRAIRDYLDVLTEKVKSPS